MVYGAQNFMYMYYERPSRKTAKATAKPAATAKVTSKTNTVNVPAFAATNIATC